MDRLRHYLWDRRILMVVAVAGVAVYGIGGLVDLGIVRAVVKPVPVLSMAAWVLGLPRGSRYRLAIAAGLLMGAVGDVLLEFPDRTLLPGLVVFLLGHLAYVAGFLVRSRRLCLVPAVLVYSFGALLLSLLMEGEFLAARGLEIPVFLYMLTICAMVWRAWTALLDDKERSWPVWAGLIGALLFLASDSILAIRIFLAPMPMDRFLIMATYWLGQVGIAASTWKGPAKAQ